MPDVTAGLTVAPMLDAMPPALRVTGIDWLSGLRDSGLRLGDQIIAVDGVALRLPSTLFRGSTQAHHGAGLRHAAGLA